MSIQSNVSNRTETNSPFRLIKLTQESNMVRITTGVVGDNTERCSIVAVRRNRCVK